MYGYEGKSMVDCVTWINVRPLPPFMESSIN